ncbi:hypothetical protein [Candidatus Steffania adelgidicola]|uniref:hypothetical protein n=1 Tax=Candidatus Steffania adelgidicola TaxID=1076626 RepID=UPI001EF05310
MIFLSQDKEAHFNRCIVEKEIKNEILSIVSWRLVPINTDVLGDIIRSSLPRIQQVCVNAILDWELQAIERRLYMACRRIKNLGDDNVLYICSLSSLVTVYKNLCIPEDLSYFCLDLSDIRLKSSICLFQ